MLKPSESSSEIRIDDTAIDAEALAALREIAAAALAAQRDGDTFKFSSYRAEVEIIAGFRPGVDRIEIHGTPRVLTTEEAGCAVIVDAQRRRIVLEGVALASVLLGDIALV